MNKKSEAYSTDLVPPDNYLLLAIISTLFCFFPIGIFAIIYSLKVSNLWKKKEYDQARLASDKAITFGQISLLLGVLFWLVLFIVC